MMDRLEAHVAEPIPGSMGIAEAVARPLKEFSLEKLGDEIILLDRKTMRYHALDAQATRIWQACDGGATSADIAREMDMPVEIVELTIEHLADVGLMASTQPRTSPLLTRRRVAKLTAAGLAGAIGLPLVQSIAVPHAASAASDDAEGASLGEESIPTEQFGQQNIQSGDPPVFTASDTVEYIDSPDMQPVLTDEQQTVLDSAQSTIDRADDVLNAADPSESASGVSTEVDGGGQISGDDNGAEIQGE